MKVRLLSLTLLLSSVISSAFAQITNQPQTGRSPLVLKVVQNPELPPNYQPLPDASGFMYFRFVRIKGWQQPPGALKVSSIYVTSVVEGEIITVRVAVLYGSGDSGSVLGSYQIRENETLTIKELTRVGIQPITITLTRVAAPIPVSPRLRNDTKGVDIVGVQASGMTLPSYQLTVRNVSAKNIAFLVITIFIDGASVGGTILEGDDGKPLVEPGGVLIADNLLVQKPEIQTGTLSPAPGSLEIVVASLIYEDGQEEGHGRSSGFYQSRVLGRKTFIRGFLRFIDRIDRERAKADNNQPEALLSFKQNLLQLQFDFNEKDVKVAKERAPQLSDPKASAEGTIRFLRRQVVGDIDALLAGSLAQRPELTQWLSSVRNRYAEWLARLDR
jgi:hypothetical protein